MNITNIKNLVQSDLAASKQLITNSCNSNVPLINNIISYLLNNDGKLIRPLITILCSHLCDYTGKEHLNIAAALELIHAASLLHDDIIDNATLRRGQITANYKWNNDAAVLAGDFLLAKSSQIIASINNTEILTTLATATSTIVEGEMLQLINKNNIDITETTYIQIISAKTAKLFEMAATLPTMLTHCSTDIKRNLATYGLHLGIAFQLIDDLLDYDYQKTAPNKLGKIIGKDLNEGKLTLPIIYLLAHGSTKEKILTKEVINTKTPELLPELQTAIASSGAIAYTIGLVNKEATLAKQAISSFVSSAYKDAACDLVNFIISRDY